jgi:hypothetical protein
MSGCRSTRHRSLWPAVRIRRGRSAATTTNRSRPARTGTGGRGEFTARFGEPDGAWYPLSSDGDTSRWPWADWAFPTLDREAAAALPCEVCDHIEKLHAGWGRGMELLALRNERGAIVFRKCARCSHTVLLVAVEFTDAQRAVWARAVQVCRGRGHGSSVHRAPCGQCLAEVSLQSRAGSVSAEGR